MDKLREALLDHGRPNALAFHIYEILHEAGYDDEEISEVASALEDIVN